MGPELLVPLILAGGRLVLQAVEGSARQRERLSDFEAFLVALQAEGRGPTFQEAAHWMKLAFQADDGLKEAIERLKQAAEAASSES